MPKLKIIVNCALPYANSSLHLGHVAGAYLNADIFVRFKRMLGHEVMFVSGSDEYGTPTTIAADRLKISPREIVDKYHKEQVESFRNLDIIFDIYSRTTYPEHTETVKDFFLDFYRKDLLVERPMVSPYCPKDARFMPDRYIEGTCPNCGFDQARGDQCDHCGKILDPQDLKSPRCILCGTEPEFRETKHMFFRLDKFEGRLLDWLETKSFWKQNVLNFTRNFIRSGLKERPITRDIEWGVPVPLPGYEHKRIYVWFEALIGYVSGAKVLSEQLGKKDYWKEFYFDPSVKMYHFMGKDNIIFHTVIWPAMLMARDGYNLPYEVVANEYLTFKGEKFSKSRKIGFMVDDLLDIVPKDYIRYYTATVLPEGSDTDFSLEELQAKVNTELIDKFGNYIHRLVSFIANNSLVIQAASSQPDESDIQAMKFAEERKKAFAAHIDSIEIKKAMGEWLELVKHANSYFNGSEPWKLVKTDMKKCQSKLYHSLLLAQDICAISYPIIPSAAEKILNIIGSKKFTKYGFSSHILEHGDSEFLPVKADPPFQKLDLLKENPNFLDLRVGKIIEAKDHPNADRLYVLKVDLGYRQAQLVAGLRKHYRPEELPGLKIIVVDNLKWTKLRGEESQGMLLAADDGETVATLIPMDESVKPGDRVTIGDYTYNSKGKIEIDQLKLMDLKMEQRNGKPTATAFLDGKRLELMVGKGTLTSYRKVADGAGIH